LTLLEGPALALRKRVVDLLGRLPTVDPQALHALGDALGGFEPQRLASFVDAVNEWLADRLASADRDRMLRIAEAWDKVNQAAHDADEYNLERKPLVFSVFGWLAEAARPIAHVPAKWAPRFADKNMRHAAEDSSALP
jgi:DNA polymerase-3 subunit delta'